jgi:hypothetical protein
MSRKFARFLACMAITGVLISGCVSEFENLSSYRLANWEPRFAVPVFDESLSLKNIIADNVADSRFSTDAQGKYIFTYHQQFSSAAANDVITLIPQAIHATVMSPGRAPAAATFTAEHVYDFAVSTGQELTKITIKQGNLSLSFQSTFKQSIGVTIELPTVLRNGVVWTSNEFVLPASGVTPVTLQAPLDMQGMHVLLNSIASQPYNKLPYKIHVRFIGSTGSVTALDALQVGLAMNNLSYAYLEGNLGDVTFVQNQKDEINIDLFSTRSYGSIFFADPQVEVRVDNSFGLGARATVENLAGITGNEERFVLRGSGIEGLKNLLVAPATVQSPLVSTQAAALNKNNVDNIVEVFSSAPRKYEYTYSLQSIPQTSSQARHQQFVYDTSSVTLHTTIKLPADGRVTDYAITDTIAAIFPEQGDVAVRNALIRLVVTNGFPVDLDLKVIVLDKYNQKVDSVGALDSQTKSMIAGAVPTAADGRVNQSKLTPQAIDFTVSEARYSRMAQQGDKMIIYARLKTAGASEGKNVTFYDTYRVRVQLGAQVKLSVGL